MKLLALFIISSSFALAQAPTHKTLYLTQEDQKYFNNDVNEGNNTFERININVKEINRLHGELASLKEQIQVIKKELAELKAKK